MSKHSEILYPVPDGTKPYSDWQPGASKGRLGEATLVKALLARELSPESQCVGVGKRISPYALREEIEKSPEKRGRLYVYTVSEEWGEFGEPRNMGFRSSRYGPVAGGYVFEHEVPPSEEEDGYAFADWYPLSDPGPVITIMPQAVLLAACTTGDVDLYERAMSSGGSLYVLGGGISNPVTCAAHSNQPAILARMIETGIMLGANYKHLSNMLKTPIENGYHEVVDQLLKHHTFDPAILTQLIGCSSDVAMAQRLKAAGADPTEVSALGSNAIFMVLMHFVGDGPEPARFANSAELIEWYAQQGVNPKQVSKYYGSALHHAVERWDIPAIRKLIELGTPRNVEYRKNEFSPRHTPQSLADAKGKGEDFRALVDGTWKPGFQPKPEPEPEPTPPSDSLGPRCEPTAAEDADHPRLEEPGVWRCLAGGAAVVVGLVLSAGTAPLVGLVIMAIGGVILLSAMNARRETRKDRELSGQWDEHALPPRDDPPAPASRPPQSAAQSTPAVPQPNAQASLRSGTITGADYPSRALRQEQEGTVIVRAGVSAEGRAISTEVTQSSGHAMLDDQTCKVIQRRFRFHPATDAQGQPIPGEYVQSVRWQL